MTDTNIFYVQEKELVRADLEMKIQAKTEIHKSPTRVRLHNDTLIVSDKFGDIHTFTFDLTSTLILGHVSMVTDFILIKDLLYTCDRDEKIRVSHYPNGYNIAFFCFGHEEYISRIVQYGDYVVSGGGDSWLGVWKQEKLIEKIDLSFVGDLEIDVLDIVVVDCDLIVILEGIDKMFVFSSDFKLKRQIEVASPLRLLVVAHDLFVATSRGIVLFRNFEEIKSIDVDSFNANYSVSQLRKRIDYNKR